MRISRSYFSLVIASLIGVSTSVSASSVTANADKFGVNKHQKKMPEHGLTRVNQQASESKHFLTYQDSIAKAKESSPSSIRVMLEMEAASMHKQHRVAKKSRGTQAFSAKSVQQNIQVAQQEVIARIEHQKISAKVVRRFSKLYNGIVVNTTEQELTKLRAISGVKKLHVLRDKVPHLAESVGRIGADNVWAMKDANEKSITGQGVTVAVIDTGIDYNHSDLGGCFGEGCKVAGGYDYLNGDDDPMDVHGHGTHVAGIIAANGSMTGVAPAATLYAYKVCDYTCPHEAILAAIEASVDPDGDPATDDGVDIVNMSLGGPGAIDDPLNIAVNEASASGTLFVISAGNEGESGFQTVGSPGNAEMALTVGSTEKNDTLSSFSSLGPVLTENFQKPEVVAPGGQINSLAPGQSVANLSGTSMAAPHVAGVAALVKQAKPTLNGQEIKSIIAATTDPLTMPYSKVGAGRVNALKAVESVVITSKHQLMMGRIDRNLDQWSASQTVTITNQSNEAVSIQTSFTNNLGSAAQYSHNLANPLTLAANSSIEVEVSVTINVGDLANAEAYTHNDVFSVMVGKQEYNLPIVYLDAFKFGWSASEYPRSVWLHNLEGKGSFLSEYYNNAEHYVLPGRYVLSSVFDKEDKVAWVAQTFEDVSQDTQVEVNSTDASHKLQITSFIDHTGAEKPVEALQGSGMFVELAHPASRERHAQFFRTSSDFQDNGLFTRKPIYVSTLSDEFKLNYSLIYGDTTTYSYDYHLYVHSMSQNVINGDIDIALDGSSASQVTINTSANNILGDKTNWTLLASLDLGEYKAPSGWYTSGAGLSGPEDLGSVDGASYLADDSKLTVHGNVFDSDRFGKYDVSLYQNISNGAISTLDFSFAEQGIVYNGKTIEQLNLNGEALWPSTSFHVWNAEINGWTTMKGQLQTTYPQELVTSWSGICEDTIFYRSSNVDLKIPSLYHEACNKVQVFAEYNNFFMGNAYLSRATHQAVVDAYSPYVQFLEIALNDVVSQGVTGSTTFDMRFNIHQDYYREGMLSAYINYQGEWQAIEVAEVSHGTDWKTEVTSQIALPALDEAHVTSLKLVVGDVSDPYHTLVMTNAFVLGGSKDDIMLIDRDNDGIADGIDTDKDNDGIPDDIEIINGLNHVDAVDAALDLDNDGVTNIAEFNNGTPIAFVESSEDSDGDGIVDLVDDFPYDPSEYKDTDGDGIGNNADTDDDNDGVDDGWDQFPEDPSESVDTDWDGIGNNADVDDDNDGVLDENDAFPLDATEWLDTDSDGIGNNTDTDDDNDGVEDSADAFPLDASESVDTDNDGIGNNADTDDDNDGVPDSTDAFPLDASRSTNTSNGNNNQNNDAGGSGGGSFNMLIMALLLIGIRRKYC
ncbi:S8 family serine peptidase [Thalassotalea fusca]